MVVVRLSSLHSKERLIVQWDVEQMVRSLIHMDGCNRLGRQRSILVTKQCTQLKCDGSSTTSLSQVAAISLFGSFGRSNSTSRVKHFAIGILFFVFTMQCGMIIGESTIQAYKPLAIVMGQQNFISRHQKICEQWQCCIFLLVVYDDCLGLICWLCHWTGIHNLLCSSKCAMSPSLLSPNDCKINFMDQQ